MIKIKKNISIREYRKLYNGFPARHRKKIEILFDALLRMKVPVDEIILTEKRKKYYMLFLHENNLVIDINSPTLVSIYEQTTQTDIDSTNENFSEIIWSSVDKRIELKKNISLAVGVDNVGLVEIDNLFKKNKLIPFKFLYDYINSTYYERKGCIQSGDIILNRSIAMDLLDFDETDVNDNDYHELYGVKKGLESEGNPIFYVYSHKRSLESTGVSEDGKTIREIFPPNYTGLHEERRFIFESIKWCDLDIPVAGEKRTKMSSTWKDEEYSLLYFHGQYILDLKESQKEGLLVWRRENSRVTVRPDKR